MSGIIKRVQEEFEILLIDSDPVCASSMRSRLEEKYRKYYSKFRIKYIIQEKLIYDCTPEDFNDIKQVISANKSLKLIIVSKKYEINYPISFPDLFNVFERDVNNSFIIPIVIIVPHKLNEYLYDRILKEIFWIINDVNVYFYDELALNIQKLNQVIRALINSNEKKRREYKINRMQKISDLLISEKDAIISGISSLNLVNGESEKTYEEFRRLVVGIIRSLNEKNNFQVKYRIFITKQKTIIC